MAMAETASSSSSRFTEEQILRMQQNKERALKIQAEKAARARGQPENGVFRGKPAQAEAGTASLQPAERQSSPWTSKQMAAANQSQQPITTRPAAGFQIRSPAKSSLFRAAVAGPPALSDIKPQLQTIVLSMTLISAERFKVIFQPFRMEVVDVLKKVPSRIYNQDDKTWNFSLADYEKTKLSLQREVTLSGKLNVVLEEPPLGARKLFVDKLLSPPALVKNEPSTSASSPPSAILPSVDLDRSDIDKCLLTALFPFQRLGILFGIQRNGRLLIADEMGLGKTVQSLALASYFRMEWPLLVVCPSSVKYTWQSQIRRFLPTAQPFVIEKVRDHWPNSRSTNLVTIVSYDLMVSRLDELRRNGIYVIIFDESHMLKEQTAKRTKAAFELSKKATRVILLSGTPALSRPVELFTQIRMIDPKIFPKFIEYATRYCDAKRGRYGLEAKGRSNPEELRTVMDKIMIRRLKKDVLEDLPEKRREVIWLSGDSISKKIKNLKKARDEFMRANHYSDNRTRRDTFMEYYVLTGLAKMEAVSEHIVDTYFYDGAVEKKMLVFAHHLAVLDHIGVQLAKAGVQFIRIDGSTSAKDRAQYCDKFQTDKRTMVALLSITAAGIGITLTAASVVIFSELYWNPSLMIQAEDRAHRVGQRDSVHVQYMLAKRTLDMDIWRLVSSKLKVLGDVNLSNENYRDAESSEKLCMSEQQMITDFFRTLEEGDDLKEEPTAKRLRH